MPEQTSLEARVIQAVEGNRYRQRDFFRVTATDYPTALSATETIDVYVTEEATDELALIDPTAFGSGAALAVNSMIVREVISANGVVNKLTVMMKVGPGFFEDGGNWSYAVVSADGSTIAEDGNGELLLGRLQACAVCHRTRPNDDFLFGVPAAYWAAH